MQLDELLSAHCQPLRGAEHRLGAAALPEIARLLPDWSLIENDAAISRTFRFTDYYRTLAFVNALAFVAHREDHHPDLGVHYDRCVVRYSTHDCGGLTRNDLVCAAKADALYADTE